MDIFREMDYRAILRLTLHERKELNPKLTSAVIAEETGIQKTYLSRVLNGMAHLNSDQLFRLTKFFQFREPEVDFIFLLLEWGRTDSNERRKILHRKISEIQLRQRSVRKNLAAKMVDESSPVSFEDYYLDPAILLVHVFLSIPAFAKTPEAIDQSLNLGRSRIERALSTLERLKIIKRESAKGSYRTLMTSLHLPGDSKYTLPHQLLLRAMASQQMLRSPTRETVSITNTFAADERTRVLIHEHFLNFLKKIEPLIAAAPSQEVYQFQFDLFPWKSS